jgi:hypothetical protein
MPASTTRWSRRSPAGFARRLSRTATTAPNCQTTPTKRSRTSRCGADFAISLGVSAAQLTGTRPNPATAALLGAGDKLTASGRYFELHQTMDIDHAGELERIIESDAALSAAAPVTAETMLEGLWNLLSSVERPPVPA